MGKSLETVSKTYMPQLVGLGQRIFKCRDDLGLSQQEVSDKLAMHPAISASRVTVGMWERSVHSPSIDQVYFLAHIFGVSFECLALGVGGGHDLVSLNKASVSDGGSVSFSGKVGMSRSMLPASFEGNPEALVVVPYEFGLCSIGSANNIILDPMDTVPETTEHNFMQYRADGTVVVVGMKSVPATRGEQRVRIISDELGITEIKPMDEVKVLGRVIAALVS